MYLVFWDVVFVCVENDVYEDGVCSVYIFRVCSEVFPVCFPIVRECVSVLL